MGKWKGGRRKMYCKGTLIFKSIEKRSGGTFKNDKGQDVNYDASYVIKADEVKDKEVNERKFKNLPLQIQQK